MWKWMELEDRLWWDRLNYKWIGAVRLVSLGKENEIYSEAVNKNLRQQWTDNILYFFIYAYLNDKLETHAWLIY